MELLKTKMYKSDERSEKSERLIAKKKTNGKARTQYVKSVETRVSKENSQEKLENQTTDHFFYCWEGKKNFAVSTNFRAKCDGR